MTCGQLIEALMTGDQAREVWVEVGTKSPYLCKPARIVTPVLDFMVGKKLKTVFLLGAVEPKRGRRKA